MSDILGILASPYETLQSKGLERDCLYVASLCEKFSVDVVVIGLPLNMDGTESEMTFYAKDFAERLKNLISAKIILQDERLTSVISNQVLIDSDISRKKRKKKVDGIAASLILQSYLDKER